MEMQRYEFIEKKPDGKQVEYIFRAESDLVVRAVTAEIGPRNRRRTDVVALELIPIDEKGTPLCEGNSFKKVKQGNRVYRGTSDIGILASEGVGILRPYDVEEKSLGYR